MELSPTATTVAQPIRRPTMMHTRELADVVALVAHHVGEGVVHGGDGGIGDGDPGQLVVLLEAGGVRVVAEDDRESLAHAAPPFPVGASCG